jgi:RNA polymerase sigma factor (sigma-70 family)
VTDVGVDLVSGGAPFAGVDAAEWDALLVRGRGDGVVHADDISHVLREVELSGEVIEAVTISLEAQGIVIDESIDDVVDAAPLAVSADDAPAEAGGDAERLLAQRRRSRAARAAERDDSVVGTGDPVRMYLKEIGRVELLNGDEERRLAKAVVDGNAAALAIDDQHLDAVERRRLMRLVHAGQQAKSELIQANLRLVVSIAKRYTMRGMQFLDLIQEGNLGLMRAVDKFDYTKGFKFSTYATWWIRQAITRGIANTGRTIRLPVHAGDTLARLQKARSRLELKFGRPATLAELSKEVEMPEDKVTEALRFAAEPLSLSEPLREDGDAELGDVVEDRSAESPFEVAATALLPEEIARLLAPLDEREREILKLRFGLDRGEPRTLEEVGEHFNLTRERIRQIEARAMSKLRHPSSDTGARDLLAV